MSTYSVLGSVLNVLHVSHLLLTTQIDTVIISILQISRLSLERWSNLLRVTQEMAEQCGSRDILNYYAVFSSLLACAKPLSECWVLSSSLLVVVLEWWVVIMNLVLLFSVSNLVLFLRHQAVQPHIHWWASEKL